MERRVYERRGGERRVRVERRSEVEKGGKKGG